LKKPASPDVGFFMFIKNGLTEYSAMFRWQSSATCPGNRHLQGCGLLFRLMILFLRCFLFFQPLAGEVYPVMAMAHPSFFKENVMGEKSYVSLEQNACVVCGSAFDTGNLLLDRRLRNSMAHHTVTGWGLCPEHQKRFDEGFVTLVECDPERSGVSDETANVKPEQVYRTGRLAHVKREVFNEIFNKPVEADQPCVFIAPGVIEQLQSMVAQ